MNFFVVCLDSSSFTCKHLSNIVVQSLSFITLPTTTTTTNTDDDDDDDDNNDDNNNDADSLRYTCLRWNLRRWLS